MQLIDTDAERRTCRSRRTAPDRTTGGPTYPKQQIDACGKTATRSGFRQITLDPEGIDQRGGTSHGTASMKAANAVSTHRSMTGAVSSPDVPLEQTLRPATARTALISTSEEMAGDRRVSPRLWMMPSSSDSRIAAAAVPGRLPSPPMMTAIKADRQEIDAAAKIDSRDRRRDNSAEARPGANPTAKCHHGRRACAGMPIAIAVSRVMPHRAASRCRAWCAAGR